VLIAQFLPGEGGAKLLARQWSVPEEGHLLVVWMALWAALLGMLALFAPAARRALAALKSSADAWSLRRAQGRARRQLWVFVQHGSRLMAELQLVVVHEQALAAATRGESAQRGKAEPVVELTAFMAQAYARDAYI